MENGINGKRINLIITAALVIFAALYYPLWLTHEEILTHDAILWFGSYSYAVDSLLNGHLPLWDPYGQSGNSFYQNISLLGLLEPIALFYCLLVKIFAISILKSYIYLSITRIAFMSAGAYFAYKHISGSNNSAKVAGAAFFMAIFPSALHQSGFVNLFMMMPWVLYFSLKYLDNIGERGTAKYLYAAVTALGISFNIYVPVYTLFYLSVFFLVSILTGAIRIPRLGILLKRSIIKELSVAAVIILLFSAIPASNYLKDMGGHGELYPFLRSYTSGVGLQKVMVSEKSDNALDSKHYGNNVITGSFLNLTQIIAPFYWKIKWKLKMHRFFQETFQFIGVTSILIIFATLGIRSRFKYPAILTTAIMALFMTSITVENPPLFYHKIITTIFPFLKLIKVYESFLGGYLFSLGLLLAMGLSYLEKEAASETLYKKNLYMQHFIKFCIAVYALMSVLLLLLFIRDCAKTPADLEKYFSGFRTYIWINLETISYFAVVMCLAFIVIRAKNLKRLNHCAAYVLIISIIFVELLFYNTSFFTRQVTLSPNYLKDDDPVAHSSKPDVYENYRSIYIPGYFRFVTFQEALLKKGAAIPDVFHGMGNVVFVSKRYYELLTHVPKDNIFAAAGVTAPKARFFESAYIASNRKEILEKMSNVSPDSLNGSLLFIEAGNQQEFKQVERGISKAEYQTQEMPALELQDNKSELIKKVFPTVGAFSSRHFQKIEDKGKKPGMDIYSLDINNIDGYPLFNIPAPADLLTLKKDVNIGRMIVLKESLAPVLLYGALKSGEPMFLNSRRSYGDMAYKEEEGPPLDAFTMIDGHIISAKPFDGYVLLDTSERTMNDIDKKIKNISFTPNSAAFSIKNERAGFLYYADGWSPYWKAYVNDKPAEVLKANYNFKAVFLLPGENSVTFIFSPTHYLFALYAYFTGLAAGAFLIVFRHIKDKTERKENIGSL